MAARENTGLQIALILFVMITVALAVTTYVYFNKAEEKIAEASKWRQTADDEKKASEKLIVENQKLREFLGYKLEAEQGPDLPKMEANFAQDMVLFAPEYEKKRDYRALPEYLRTQITDLDQQLVKANERADSLIGQVGQARKDEQTNVKKYVDQKEDLDRDLAKVRTDFKDERTRAVTQMEDLQARLDNTSKEVASVKATKQKEIDNLANRVAKLTLLKDTLTEKVSGQRPKTTENPDGIVTWVSQQGGTVYINVGSADGLSRSTIFSVLDASVSNVATAQPKASLEVTTIRGPHLAEARIIDDSLSNPILTRDKIYSPVWSPGQRTHFALVGFMDINDDGNSDRDLVRNIITMNGGVVDAEVLDSGDRRGKLTINTRYMVMGERATEKSSAEALRGYSDLIKEAADLGIEKIGVERLLNDMGWRGTERTVGAKGESIGSGTFAPRTGGAAEPEGEKKFQPRTRSGRGSAY